MVSLQWGRVGTRQYEGGVDRGVLYPQVGPGVPWDGLISVTERSTGGDAMPYYYDGYKYLNVSASEEFEADIEAFSAPKEFARCDGTYSVGAGLYLTQQPRESFDFSYRTMIGNDVDGQEHAYKLHLVYGALAAPSDRSNVTLSNDPSPATLSWSVTTAPPLITGFRPTAHVVFDSRETPADFLTTIEETLYGNALNNPSMPDMQSLITSAQTW